MNEYHILLIAPFYSDSVLTGSQRAFSFAKHLPRNGIRVSVITTHVRDENEKTIGKFNETICRVNSPLWCLEQQVLRVRNLLFKKSGRVAPGPLNPANPYQSDKWYKRPFNMPDQHWAWAFLAYIRAAKIHKTETIDAVLSTSPAESAHIAGWLLKRRLQIPWIADLRDGWMFEPYKVVRLRKGPRRDVELFLEKTLLRQADRITTVTRPIGDDLVNRLNIPRNRIYVLPNGYDPDEWQVPQEIISQARRQLEKAGKPIIILHMGRISSARMDTRADELFAALAKLKKTRHEIYAAMKFMFYGADSYEEPEIVRRLGITDAVVFCPRVPKKEAIALMMAADGLLLITSNSQTSIATSKLFDYMAAGKPLFALAGGNAAESIIRETNAGITVSPLDADDIYDKLVLFYSWIEQKTVGREYQRLGVQQYERGRQAGRLSDIIKSMRP